jgi:hypothetical protein
MLGRREGVAVGIISVAASIGLAVATAVGDDEGVGIRFEGVDVGIGVGKRRGVGTGPADRVTDGTVAAGVASDPNAADFIGPIATSSDRTKGLTSHKTVIANPTMANAIKRNSIRRERSIFAPTLNVTVWEN